MKQQSFFLSSLLVVHSFNLLAQPNKYEGLFGRSREQTPEIKREYYYYAAPKSAVNIYAVVVGVGQYTAMPKLRYTGGHEEVFRILQSSRAQHKLCIADACYSGGLDYTADLASKGYVSSSSQPLYREYERAESGIALLMSSSAGEPSLEDRVLRQGVFTYFLLRGMSGAADYNYDGIVNIKELFHYVSHKVPEYTYGAQSPWLSGDYDDDMPIAIGE